MLLDDSGGMHRTAHQISSPDRRDQTRVPEARNEDGANLWPPHSQGHLYRPEELPEVLRLSADQVSQLEATGQITATFVCGEKRFSSREIDELINSYLRVAKRKQYHEKGI